MDLKLVKIHDEDDEDLKKDEAEQQREIQALLTKEFDDLEVNDYSDNDMENCESFDENDDTNDSKLELNLSNDSNEKENFLVYTAPYMNQAVPNWNYNHPYNFFSQNQVPKEYFQNPYKCLQNNNHNFSEDIENSETWEISLHGEMGNSVNNNFHKSLTGTADHNVNKPPLPNKKLTSDVGVECIPVNQRELDNLELLYDARGKRIDQLSTDLENEREKRLKETRILNHKLTMLEAELKSAQGQVKSSYEVIENQRKQIDTNNDVIENHKEQLSKLEDEVSRLQETLCAKDAVIEDISNQLSEINTMGCIAKNNQKQEDLMDCISRQHITETSRLTSEMYRLNGRLDEKMNVIKQLELQIDDQANLHHKQLQDWKLERQKIIDELSQEKEKRRGLENNQNEKHIEEMEQCLVNMETDKLIVEDVNKYMQEELNELTFKLYDYEQKINDFSKTDAIMPLSLNRCSSSPDLYVINKVESTTKEEEWRKKSIDSTIRIAELNRQLSDLRKYNLDIKIKVRQLEQQVAESYNVKYKLETKVKTLSVRISQLEGGEETDAEKCLKESNKSLEAIKASLEEQCKLLKQQLEHIQQLISDKTAELVKMKTDYDNLKVLSVKEKDEAVTEVKNVCSNHFEQLRHQLEISWLQQKQMIIDEEEKRRHAVEHDLQEALSEIDNLKKLYIDVCHEKSNIEQDKKNWSEWMTRKLEDQKQSLNQQFKNDKKNLVSQLNEKFAVELETVKQKMETKPKMCDVSILVKEIKSSDEKCDKAVAHHSVLEYNDVAVGSDALLEEIAVQVNHNCADSTDEQLNSFDLSNTDLKKKILKLEEQNATLTEALKLQQTDLNKDKLESGQNIPELIPNLVRSTTPILIHSSKKPPNPQTTYENEVCQSNVSNFHNQFKKLKSELIQHLSDISNSVNNMNSNNTRSANLPIDVSSNVTYCKKMSDLVIFRVQEQLKSCLLEIQTRAAVTLQRELLTVQKLTQQYLIDRLKCILPISLSVEAEFLDLDMTKVQLLLNKLVMVLNHSVDNVHSITRPSDSFENCTASAAGLNYDYITSTPKDFIINKEHMFGRALSTKFNYK